MNMQITDFISELIQSTSVETSTEESFLIRVAAALEKATGCESVHVIGHRNAPQSFFPLAERSQDQALCDLLLNDKAAFQQVEENIWQGLERHLIPIYNQKRSVGFVFVFKALEAGAVSQVKELLDGVIRDLYRLIHQHRVQAALAAEESAADLISQLTHDFNAIVTLLKSEQIKNQELAARLSRSDSMLDDLLLYIRDADLITSDLPLEDLIRAVIDTIDVPDDVTLTFHSGDAKALVHADAELFSIAIRAIVKNAIEALQLSGGSINISTRVVENKSVFLDNNWAIINVIDDGPGIAGEFLPFIENPFFTTAKHQGRNGLGLPVAKKMMAAHGGTLTIHSKHGSGTQVDMTMPLISNGQ